MKQTNQERTDMTTDNQELVETRAEEAKDMATATDAPMPAKIQDNGINPLIQMFSQGSISIAEMKELMELQVYTDKLNAERAYNAALAQFRQMAPSLKRDKTVQYQNRDNSWTHYKHSTLGYTMSEVNPLLGKCGLNLSWRPRQEGNLIYVVTRLSHALGFYEEVQLFGDADTSGGKNKLQGVGSTISYLERQGAFGILGLASSDDDDDGVTGGNVPPAEPEKPIIINEKQAGVIEDLLTGIVEYSPDFRDLWVKHYGGSFSKIETPPGLSIPVTEYKAMSAELDKRLAALKKKAEEAGDPEAPAE